MSNSINELPYGTRPARWEDVKICTYAMCKNELKFVDKWLENVWLDGKGSDYICVLDTGSTDGTYERLRARGDELGIPQDRLILDQREIKPWRFDVGRNESMKLIPDPHLIDYCYCIDLDELLIPDFWEDLRKTVFLHPDAERVFYQYAWSHDSETGDPKWYFWYDKTHGPVGWKWFSPCHERLVCDPEVKAVYASGTYILDQNKIYLHHYPDPEKSRGSYLGLLEIRAQEEPDDLYGLFYLAREFTSIGKWADALKWAMLLYARILKGNPTPEELAIRDDMMMLPSLCILIGECFSALGIKSDTEYYYRQSIKHDPTFREGYVSLAQFCAYNDMVDEGFSILEDMEKKSVRVTDWRAHGYAWRKWKKQQIIGDLLSWDCLYKDAVNAFAEGELDIKTKDDRAEASSRGFYGDKKFSEDRLQVLENYAKRIDFSTFSSTNFDELIDAAVANLNITEDYAKAHEFFEKAIEVARAENDKGKIDFATRRLAICLSKEKALEKTED